MLDRKFRLPRIWSNKILEKYSHRFTGEIINISGWKDEDKEGRKYSEYFSNASSYTISNFKGERGLSGLNNEVFLDLESDMIKNYKNRFDVCFNHTTLEHIYNFQKAFDNICLMSRDIVILVLPFAQMVHETDSFGDYWRFTPTAINRMFHENKMGILLSAYNNNCNSGLYTITIASKKPDKWKNIISFRENENILGYRIGLRVHQRIKTFFKRIAKYF